MKIASKIIIQLILSVIIIATISILLHELGHLIIGLLSNSGYYGFTLFQNNNTVTLHFNNTNTLMFYFGGLFSSIVLTILYILLRNKLNWKVKSVLFLIIITQFSYGIYEGFNSVYNNQLFNILNYGLLSIPLILIIVYCTKQIDKEFI
jgi:hypothetical protein